MDVLSIIAVIFIENLIAILGLAAFVFLLREFHRRRQRHLLFFAGIFACLGLANAALYFGQVLNVYGLSTLASVLVRGRPFFSVVEALLIFVILIDLYGGRLKWFWSIFAPAFPIISLYVLLTGPKGLVPFHGLVFPELGIRGFIGAFGAWMIANVVLLAVHRLESPSAYHKGTHFHGSERQLLAAGFMGVLFFSCVIVVLFTKNEAIFYVGQIAYLAHLVFLFFGAATIEHPEPLYREQPIAVLSRSLVLKAAGLTAALFWTLAFILLAMTSSYFVSSSVGDAKESLRRDVHFFSRSYSGFGNLFLEETLRLAQHPRMSDLLDGKTDEAPAELREFIEKGRGRRILRIADTAGVIVWSSLSSEERGTMLPSAVLTKALGGVPVAATEREETDGSWAVRAAAPLVLPDGTTGGVLLGTNIDAALDFSDYAGISPQSAAGYGFVSEDGQLIFHHGEAIDELAKTAFRKDLNGGGVNVGDDSDGSLFAVENARATDGSPDGWFYIFLTREMFESLILRILSLVAFILILALLAVTAILIFSIDMVLRPIKELRAGAHLIEQGDYSTRVSYAAPDELGDLAIAFNQMGETIGDRTRSLNTALEEERDFLMHTAMEMRSPLNVFRWTIEMMRFGDTGRLTKEQLELLEQMHQTTQRLIGFSQKLLDASLLQQGKISLKKQSVQIEDLVDEVAGEYSIKLREKDINLHWNRPSKPLPPVSGDRERIKQVLKQVIGNAVKYTKDNGHIEVSVQESSLAGPGARHGRFLKMAVEDNGRGIPKDEQARVFVPFFRGSNIVKEDIQGIGLGLSITKELVKLHGGRIWFESEEGSGTTFFFTFPVERAPRLGVDTASKNNPSL